MTTVTKLSKKLRLSLRDTLRLHLLTEVVGLQRAELIASDLDLLALLAESGESGLPAFCTYAAEQLGTREQSIRNRMVILEKRNLVVKQRPGVITLVKLHPDLAVATHQPLLLDYQLLGV